MKKLFLVAAVAVFGFTGMNAQTEQGGWMLGASSSLSFASNSTTPEFDGEEGGKTTVSVFSVAPNVNYFVVDNLAVGLDLQVSSQSVKIEDVDDDGKASSLYGALAGTYFFGSEEFKPYAGVNVGYMTTSEGDDDMLKYSGLAFGGKLGVAYFLTDSVSINFQADYINSNLSNKEESDLKSKGNTIGVGIGFALYL